MKKLDKKALKALIMESLQEIEGDVPESEVAAAAQDPDRVRSTEAEGIVPEDIAGYFKQVGDELKQRIEQSKKAPPLEVFRMSPEQVQEAIQDMKRVQDELEEIKKTLHTLEKRHIQNMDLED